MKSAFSAPPSNDSFANAIEMIGAFDIKPGTNVDATRQPAERTETKQSTVWYKWTAPSNGRARFAALPSANGSYMQISVWLGDSFPTLVYLGGVWSFKGEAALADLPVAAGALYHICVGRDSSGTTHQGPFDCSVVLQTNGDIGARNVVAATANNHQFANAIPLAGTNDTAIAYSLDASMREAGEPVQNPDYSAWWKWTAPATGYGLVSLAGTTSGNYYRSGTDKSLLVYKVDSRDGCCGAGCSKRGGFQSSRRCEIPSRSRCVLLRCGGGGTLREWQILRWWFGH